MLKEESEMGGKKANKNRSQLIVAPNTSLTGRIIC